MIVASATRRYIRSFDFRLDRYTCIPNAFPPRFTTTAKWFIFELSEAPGVYWWKFWAYLLNITNSLTCPSLQL